MSIDTALTAVAGGLQTGMNYMGASAQADAQNNANQTNIALASDSNQLAAEEAALNRTFNAEQAGISRAYNWDAANAQRDWAATLSNTAHQREVSDLKAAGLNPILSVMGGSGSATPSGSSASSPTASGVQPSLTTASVSPVPPALSAMGDAMKNAITNYSAYQSAQQTAANIDNIKANNKLIQAQTLLAGANTTSALASTDVTKTGVAGRFFGSDTASALHNSAVDAGKSIFDKVSDLISNTNVSSAQKVNPMSLPPLPASALGWSRGSTDVQGVTHYH